MSVSRLPARPLKDNSIDPGEEFPLGVREYFFYLLYLAARRRDLFIEETLPANLNHSHWRSLAIIRRLGPCSMKTLATFSTVDRTTLTRSVDQLAAAGYVLRETPPGDRRRVDLTITEAGEAVYQQAVAAIKASNKAALTEIDDDDLRAVTRTLRRVLKLLVDDEALARDMINFGRPAPRNAREI